MNEIVIPIVTGFLGLFIGHVLSVSNSLREQKAKIYGEILPALLKAVYSGKPQKPDISQLNLAISKLWLYADKEVAQTMDKALGILVDPNRGDLGKELKYTIILMRNDVQLPWKRHEQELNPDEFTHLYFDEEDR